MLWQYNMCAVPVMLGAEETCHAAAAGYGLRGLKSTILGYKSLMDCRVQGNGAVQGAFSDLLHAWGCRGPGEHRPPAQCLVR